MQLSAIVPWNFGDFRKPVDGFFVGQEEFPLETPKVHAGFHESGPGNALGGAGHENGDLVAERFVVDGKFSRHLDHFGMAVIESGFPQIQQDVVVPVEIGGRRKLANGKQGAFQVDGAVG